LNTVGAIIDRPQILPKQNPSPQGEKYGYVHSENPKNNLFRRAISDRPYGGRMKMEYPTRKKNRLSNYDYSQNGAYFITICTENRKCLLSTIVGAIIVSRET
jgi:hypothetical protein